MEATIPISELFEQAKKVYGQTEETFYISSRPYMGQHIGIMPDRQNYNFSEYIFGNYEEMIKICKSAVEQNIFKSFYCSLCAIEEPDNLSISTLPPCKEIKLLQNTANQIKYSIKIDEIEFLITGTVPQYYYNHLLLSTKSHYNTYSIFLNLELFSAFFKVLEIMNLDETNIKAVFNGNFGSDRWHFHSHITNQKISYIEDSLANTDLTKDYDNTGSYGVVKYRLIASRNIKNLFNRLNMYTNIYYTDVYQKGIKYLSAVFKYFDGIYVVFLITGNKYGGLKISNTSYFSISPSAILSVSGRGDPTPQNLEQTIKDMERKGVYEYIHLYKLDLKNVLTAETFELQFKRDCPSLKKIANDKKIISMIEKVDSCLSKSSRCTGDMNTTFATYKYFMSLWFICQVGFNYGNSKVWRSIESIMLETYQSMMKSRSFSNHAIKASIGYLTHTYNIESSKNIFLRGPFASEILRRSFNNFKLITSEDYSRIDSWVEYEHGPVVPSKWNPDPTPPIRIGENSAMGAVMRTYIKSAKHIEFVIKANKRQESGAAKIFKHEFAAGIKINSLRDRIPNYVLTLGGFDCNSDPNLDRLCQRPTRFGVDPVIMQFIMLEYIEGDSFKKYILNPLVSTSHIICALAQISIALLYGQLTLEFTHYDLHTDNILLSKIMDQSSNPPLYKYKIGSEIYMIPAYVNCIIIDYGDAHVSGLHQYYEDPGNVHWGKRSSQYDPYKDMFSLIIHTLLTYCQGRTEKEVYDALFNQNNHLCAIFTTFFESYGYLFVNNVQKVLFDTLVNHNFFKQPNIDKKFVYLKSLFNKLRIDNHYFLYLPSNKYPSKGLFSDHRTLTKALIELTSLGSRVTTSTIYNWGDRDDIGCIEPEIPSNKEKIKNIRKIIKNLN